MDDPVLKKLKLYPYFTPYTKVSLNWTLNNMMKSQYDATGKGYRMKTKQIGYIKLINFCMARGTQELREK